MGSRIDEIAQLREMAIEHLWPVARPFDQFSSPGGFTIFTQGEGCRVTDIDGNNYIDYWANVMLNNVGYGRSEIVDAIYEQVTSMPFAPTHEPTIPKIRLAKKLADITPGSLSKVFFAGGGSESIETALKIAWKYHRLSGARDKYKIIGGYTYHGSTYGAMSTGWRPPVFDWKDFPPTLPGMVRISSPHCAVCDFGLKYPDCQVLCARQLERTIQLEGPDSVAAFLDVPIPSSAYVPPPEYWPIVRSICDKYDVLLIQDCIQSGFGRFGKMFAIEHYEVVPDIMVVAKALASGYMPISAAIVRKEIAERFEGGRDGVLNHSYTFEGHPVACAAALATLDVMEREDLVENSRTMGEYLLAELETLYRHKIVGEVRGLGLNCAVELVSDRESGERFSPAQMGSLSGLLKKRLMEAGLFGLFANPISIIPSLTVTKDDVDEMVGRFSQALVKIESDLNN